MRKSSISHSKISHPCFSALVDSLNFRGDLNLLDSKKIAIIGTRSPNQYTKIYTAKIASAISQIGVAIVSGGALGVDIIAHENSDKPIMISPSGLDVIYPASNSKTIEKIAQRGVILSEYEANFRPFKQSFLDRNRIIIHISDAIIIPQADLESGSMNSARLAIRKNKPLFVLPHRLNESLGTASLLQNGRAKMIYSLESLVSEISELLKISKSENEKSAKIEVGDEILEFCKSSPSFEEALKRFGDRLLEYEILGKIKRVNGRIML